jgi:biopolymer transport protein ExbB
MRAAIATLSLICTLGLAAPAAHGQAEPAAEEPKTLFELLDMVKHGLEVERAENLRRVQEFMRAKENQERLLAEARATLASKEEISQQLEDTYNENDATIGDKEARLTERLGQLGELFGVVRQVAGEAAGQLEASLVSAQIPDREVFLQELAQTRGLPSIEKLQRLWFELQREMTEQGKVVRFPAEVTTVEGGSVRKDVTRIGVFNVVADGEYLQWIGQHDQLAELGRQPSARYLGAVDDFEKAQSGLAAVPIDPARGQLLALLVETPDARERVAQGGIVGYAIIVLGGVAGLLGLVRLAYVLVVRSRVRRQEGREGADAGNPLGRVLGVYEENRDLDTEVLELKLDEQILRESAGLERFTWVIKVVSVVAPLMGLLGTVTGMIQTFQAITLFGTGDPKLMAGGISEALVTTMLGLIVAIPLVLLHSVMASASRSVVEVLEERSAGIVAERAEKEAKRAGAA